MIKLKLRAYFIPIALLLYVFELIAGSYSTTPIGLSIDFNTRNGPFFGTIFFAIGLYFSQSGKSFSLTFAIVLTLLGVLLHFLEIFVLWHFYHISPLRHDYLLGTVLFGIGVALIALAKPSLGKNLFITQFGTYMLGVYVVHVAFVEYLSAFRFNHVLWEVVFPIVVFVASLLTTVVLAKFRLLRKFVI